MSLLNSGLTNLVNNYIIDARYNKYAIIIYCTFALIPHEGTMLVTLSCFMNEMKLTKHCFRANLDSHLKVRCGSFVNFAWLIMVNTNVGQFSFFHENCWFWLFERGWENYPYSFLNFRFLSFSSCFHFHKFQKDETWRFFKVIGCQFFELLIFKGSFCEMIITIIIHE